MKNFSKIVIPFVLVFALIFSMSNFAFAAATGAPGTAQLAHNQWGGDVDGDFDLTWNMWYGNNATSWKLFEKIGAGNFSEIDSGSLADSTPSVQSGAKQIRGRTISCTYYYYLTLTNSYGSTNSNTVSIIVGNATGDILLQGIDVVQTVNQFIISNGTSDIPLSCMAATTPTYTVATNNSSVINCSIVNNDTLRVQGLKGGRASIIIRETTTNKSRYVGVRVKNVDGTLPGMPDYVSIGSVSEDKDGDLAFWRDFQVGDKNKRADIRYIYINGGPIGGWRTWTSVDGDRARVFIRESVKLGMIPFFVFYNIPDSAEDYNLDLAHIQNTSYMEAYYKDLKFLLDLCKQEAGDDVVGLVFEPDFLGYMMQQSGKQPNQISAQVSAAYSSGVLSTNDPTFSNTVEGLVKSINYTVNKYYPQAYYGWQFNLWAYSGTGVPSNGILHVTETMGMTEGRNVIRAAAQATTDYYMSAGISSYGADFVSIDKYGLDGGALPGASVDPLHSTWLWNADIWNNYLEFVKVMKTASGLPVILWQIPVGHINASQESDPYDGGLFTNLDGTDTKYEDSAPRILRLFSSWEILLNLTRLQDLITLKPM